MRRDPSSSYDRRVKRDAYARQRKAIDDASRPVTERPEGGHLFAQAGRRHRMCSGTSVASQIMPSTIRRGPSAVVRAGAHAAPPSIDTW
jgi:hypothetical protein